MMDILELPLTILGKFLKWLFTDNKLIRKFRRKIRRRLKGQQKFAERVPIINVKNVSELMHRI